MKKEKSNCILIIAIIALVVTALMFGLIIGVSLRWNEEIEKREISDDSKFIITDSDKSIISIPAVDNKGQGVFAILETNIREGSGLVLVNINDVIAGHSTQLSARTAVRAAEKYLDFTNENLDVIYNIKTEAGFIEGPSAGAAMAVALVSLIEEKPINEKVSVTGYIEESGIIGPASSIEQKAKALSEEGFEILVVSDQVALPREYVRKEKCGIVDGNKEYCVINYVADEELIISNIKIVSVRDLKEAMEYFYND